MGPELLPLELANGASSRPFLEYRKFRRSAGGRTVDDRKFRPERSDNHWLDCLVGNTVAALMQGVSLEETGPVRLPQPKKFSLSGMQQAKRRERELAWTRGIRGEVALSVTRFIKRDRATHVNGIKYAHSLLGHSNNSTTQRDTHLDDRELAEAQDMVGWGRAHNSTEE